jgi:hypothetical protein
LVSKSSAVLASVAVQNYVCYGRRPHRPDVGLRYTANDPSPPTLEAALSVRDDEGSVRFECPAVVLRNLQTTSRQTIWSGFDRARRLQVIWVWDFFRIQSHLVLRVALADSDLPAEAVVENEIAWRDTLAAIRAITLGNSVRIDVKSECGDIHQVHAVQQPVYEWSPQTE